jgi:hypothetical protein
MDTFRTEIRVKWKDVCMESISTKSKLTRQISIEFFNIRFISVLSVVSELLKAGKKRGAHTSFKKFLPDG